MLTKPLVLWLDLLTRWLWPFAGVGDPVALFLLRKVLELRVRLVVGRKTHVTVTPLDPSMEAVMTMQALRWVGFGLIVLAALTFAFILFT